jgi:signal peptidase
MIFMMDEHRLAGDAAHAGTGVVTYRTGAAAGYSEFDDYGDVIIFRPDGSSRETPIIHRARFWVEAGEDWYSKANQTHLRADGCAELRTCPAPHSGFVTKGDNNPYYDQSNYMAISGPVKPAWIVGTAELRIPWLGWVRLQLADSPAPTHSSGFDGPEFHNTSTRTVAVPA